MLCTPNKTYNIRQKNSSNTVYILQPGQEGSTSNGSFTEPDLIGISKSESTLETLPSPKLTAATYIRRLLPVLATTGQATGTQTPLTKDQLFADVPFSDAECETAFSELSAFVDQSTENCVVPSAQYKLQAWLTILENSRAKALDLTSELNTDEILSLKDNLEDLPPGFFEAILHAFASTSGQRTSIDPDRLVRWVGLNRLESDAPKTATLVSSFKASWKDALPEKLRDKVDLALIGDRHQLSAGGRAVAFKDYALDLIAGVDGTGASESKSALGTKRKWHDKFKPAKKAN